MDGKKIRLTASNPVLPEGFALPPSAQALAEKIADAEDVDDASNPNSLLNRGPAGSAGGTGGGGSGGPSTS